MSKFRVLYDRLLDAEVEFAKAPRHDIEALDRAVKVQFDILSSLLAQLGKGKAVQS